MPAFSTTHRVPFTARQMYDLVADVEQYPHFLPLCEGLRVEKRSREDGKAVLICAMTVGYHAIRESFTSRVTLDPATLQVHAGSAPEYPSGPFRSVDNRCWSAACSTASSAATPRPSRNARGRCTARRQRQFNLQVGQQPIAVRYARAFHCSRSGNSAAIISSSE